MPQGDGTGPNGSGPRTGRGMGFCNGYSMPGCINSGFGRGFRGGRGRGFGRGMAWRNGWNMPVEAIQPVYPAQQVELSKAEQKKILEAELKELETEKKEIEKELKSLKG